ncbi:MAG: heparinase II/III family protein [Marinibacterium sp.]|nr:heparinase II/III family protein [Marinibacterium sp.]
MARQTRFADRIARFRTWMQLRRCLRQPAPTGFALAPEPWMMGQLLRGRQLAGGVVTFAGHTLEGGRDAIWTAAAPDAAFESDRQGFRWLEDLATLGDKPARALAQDWMLGWIATFGSGAAPGWQPDFVGRRVIRWINHADFVMRGLPEADRARILHLLGAQIRYLALRWPDTTPGLPRIEALCALIHGAQSLDGLSGLGDAALEALVLECDTQIGSDGAIPERNPEALLDMLTLLIWAGSAVSDRGHAVPGGLVAAIQRIAPVLRALRHSDGSLPRFHGGGSGVSGRLDHALAASGVTRSADGERVMGYARLQAARVSVLIDAAPPPIGAGSQSAHASTLGIEVTSGRRPILVSCGPGAPFGDDWKLAARSTPSQSVLCLDGYSSARVDLDAEGSAPLADGPTQVPIELRRTSKGTRFQAGHDGYVASHGLTHARTLMLGLDGRRLTGEDMLLAVEDGDRQRFDRVRHAAGPDGVPFEIRFHLHPEVTLHHDATENRLVLMLKSGEAWLFLHDGSAELTVEDSIYLENGRLGPRATKQVVLTGAAMQYSTRVKWSLAKTQATADVTRDILNDVVDPYE